MERRYLGGEEGGVGVKRKRLWEAGKEGRREEGGRSHSSAFSGANIRSGQVKQKALLLLLLLHLLLFFYSPLS